MTYDPVGPGVGATPAAARQLAGVAHARAEATGAVTGARVYLHSAVRRGYLASVVAAVAQDLRLQGAVQVHVVTGWRFGPHFDLRASGGGPGGPIDWAPVAQDLADGASRFPAIPDAAGHKEYLRTAALLGRIESVPPPYLPLRPHGHIELLPADPSPVWQGRLGILRATGLAHLLAPLTDAARSEAEGALLARVAEAFLALAASHPHGVRFGTFSFRSHAEAFFHWAGPGADYRASFQRRMERDRAVLEELVGRVRDACPSDPARQWQHAFHRALADFTDQVTDADLDRAAPAVGPASRGVTGAAGASAFHRAVAASGVIDQPPAWFAGYRLLINLFYQLLPALDISPVRRFYLCHAIAETVDAVFGESWQDRLAAIEALTPAGAVR